MYCVSRIQGLKTCCAVSDGKRKCLQSIAKYRQLDKVQPVPPGDLQWATDDARSALWPDGGGTEGVESGEARTNVDHL